jgi:hypothetical protein
VIECLDAFALVVAAVVAGIVAAEGLKWALRAQPKGRINSSLEDLNAGLHASGNIPRDFSEESVLATLRDLGSSPLYPSQGSILTREAFGQLETDHHIRPKSRDQNGR